MKLAIDPAIIETKRTTIIPIIAKINVTFFGVWLLYLVHVLSSSVPFTVKPPVHEKCVAKYVNEESIPYLIFSDAKRNLLNIFCN